MFICEKCLKKGYDNHTLSFISRGNCEICEKYEPCYDIPSSRLNPKQTKPMEKTLKMSVETARQIYKDYNFCMEIKSETSLALLSIYKIVMENFTKEELEGKKGFNWEDCWPLHGFYFDNKAGFIQGIGGTNLLRCNQNKHVFKTEKQAKSALAFAQLSHIVAKYNEGKTKDMIFYKIRKEESGDLCVIDNCVPSHLEFYSITDAQTSLEVNRELWLDYFMINA